MWYRVLPVNCVENAKLLRRNCGPVQFVPGENIKYSSSTCVQQARATELQVLCSFLDVPSVPKYKILSTTAAVGSGLCTLVNWLHMHQ